MKPGDLVLPKESYEHLYPDRASMYDSDRDQTVYLWYADKPGVVIKIARPPGGCDVTYNHVYILVGDHVGWTYSDFLRIINEPG